MPSRTQPSHGSSDDVVDLREYVGVVRRRKWLIIAFTIFFTALAAAYSFSLKPLYAARAVVLVQPPDSQSFRPDQLVSLDTEARIVASEPIALLAKETLNVTADVTALLKKLSVKTAPDTLVLDILFTDGDRQDAADGANAFAQAYLDYKRQSALDRIVAQRTAIEEEISDLNDQRRQQERILSRAAPGSLEYEDAQQARDTINSQIAVATSQLGATAIYTDPGRILLSATRPTTPSSPKHPVDLAIGLFVGMFLGLIAAFVRDRTDERITGRTDLERSLGAPVLAVIPAVAGWNKRGPVWLVTEQQPRSPAAEAYRTLRTAVLAASRAREIKVIAVTSAVLGEGKSATSANLAAALAHAEKRVLLISADLRRPSIHHYYQEPNSLGLSDVLLGDLPVNEAVRHMGPGLWLLTSGRSTPHPAELLQSRKMVELVREQRDRFDFVIIDCPPILGLADTLALAPNADTLLIVARDETSKSGAIAHTRELIDQVGATVMGGILNDASLSKRGSDAYGYGYGYGYTSDDELEEPKEANSAFGLTLARGREMGTEVAEQDPMRLPDHPPANGASRSDEPAHAEPGGTGRQDP